MHEVVDREMPGPDGDPADPDLPAGRRGPLPVLVYFFGGGWTLGSIDTSDGVCRSLANGAGCLVVAVGYRLAPEHQFPAAVHDCYAAVRWVAEHGRGDRRRPGPHRRGRGQRGRQPRRRGHAAGPRREGGPALAGQLLVYPNTDYRADTASLRESTDPALFNRTSVAWYWSHYLATPEDGANPLASPLRADDLAGLPPALVITAEYDPLRDEGEAYARRLAEAGVPGHADPLRRHDPRLLRHGGRPRRRRRGDRDQAAAGSSAPGSRSQPDLLR